MLLILLIIGIVLIIYSYCAIRKEDKIKKEDNSLNISFKSVLQDSKNEISDYKIEIGILRKDIAESLTELQEEIIEIKNNINKLKNSEKIYENINEMENLQEDIIDTKSFYDSSINNGIVSEISFSEKVDSDKTQSIKKLLGEGLTVEQICYKLSVSKGEVLLVKGLFKK